jgi:DNA-binding CsgD family transcriptional regulator
MKRHGDKSRDGDHVGCRHIRDLAAGIEDGGALFVDSKNLGARGVTSAIDCIPTPPCVMGGGNGAAKGLEDAGPRNRSLTARQKAVLELLSRGETNKVIARRLGMREGTVKVHVRQIMHKFGVTNRTQLAVVCANGRPSQNGGATS